jgi:hypothetical protein
VKQHERDEWNNRPMTVTSTTLCEGGCNQLKTDVQPRQENIFNYSTYEWMPLKNRNCCNECWRKLVAEARYPAKPETKNVDA